ncbi:uncharacterized protein LACBIDRAFT_335486 [Laccaria bicolor S238N-H82]|uniref:Predicted protein n=1 Tax=Laccaria bicolor (strain S238N-H82 / ATCC MYA-4686) TaxID=486041 RepID=B0E2E9_LACBS|nr:uncharacterized protein LACBIDRAFT_335486 [Laccaria bicolor S238N-H82]EDQ98968.1 predicted protein [Laccaria bicolor S238N-H82]|eukprot:XP_001890370.1 predicted protein [Laccaria bicolor S238N-H82]
MRCTRRHSWFEFCNHCTRRFMDFLRKPTLMSGAGTFDIYATSHMHQEALRTCVSHHDHISKVALPSPTALHDITRFRADLLSYPMRFEAYIGERLSRRDEQAVELGGVSGLDTPTLWDACLVVFGKGFGADIPIIIIIIHLKHCDRAPRKHSHRVTRHLSIGLRIIIGKMGSPVAKGLEVRFSLNLFSRKFLEREPETELELNFAFGPEGNFAIELPSPTETCFPSSPSNIGSQISDLISQCPFCLPDSKKTVFKKLFVKLTDSERLPESPDTIRDGEEAKLRDKTIPCIKRKGFREAELNATVSRSPLFVVSLVVEHSHISSTTASISMGNCALEELRVTSPVHSSSLADDACSTVLLATTNSGIANPDCCTFAADCSGLNCCSLRFW